MCNTLRANLESPVWWSLDLTPTPDFPWFCSFLNSSFFSCLFSSPPPFITPSLSSPLQKKQKTKNKTDWGSSIPCPGKHDPFFVSDVKKDPGRKKKTKPRKKKCVSVCVSSRRGAALGRTARCHPPPGQHADETRRPPGRGNSHRDQVLRRGERRLSPRPRAPLAAAVHPRVLAEAPLAGAETPRRSRRRRFSVRFAVVTDSSSLFLSVLFLISFFLFVTGLFSLQRNAYNHQEISQGKEK